MARTTIPGGIFRRLQRDKRGMAATEFAMFAPVMLALYFGVTELSDALMAKSKVTQAVSAAADLVAQDAIVTSAEVSDIFSAVNMVMYPFEAADTQIVISSVLYESPGQGKVDWSVAQNSGARSKGSFVSVPTGLLSVGTSLIFAEIKYTYTSPAGELIYGTILMDDQFYLRPRKVSAVGRDPPA